MKTLDSIVIRIGRDPSSTTAARATVSTSKLPSDSIDNHLDSRVDCCTSLQFSPNVISKNVKRCSILLTSDIM